jgi:hypothetical protein
MATSVTAFAAGQQPLLLVISHSHWSSATVTGHQPQSLVIRHCHRSSATVSGLHRAVTAAVIERGGFSVVLRTAAGGFSTGCKPIKNPAHSFYRGGTSHLHHWDANFFQISAAGQCKLSSSQEGVRPDGEGRHRLAIRQPLVTFSPYSDEAGRQLVTARRLAV